MPTPSDAPGAPAAPTILVVDDERNIRRTLDLVLSGAGYQVLTAPDAEEARLMLDSGEHRVDLAIVDINLPGMSGLDLLARLREDAATRVLPVIVISGSAGREDAAQAIRLGAGDFFEKPLNRERVLVSVANALEVRRLARDLAALSASVESRYEMVGQSAVMRALFAAIESVAPSRAGILITGETGTGKELVSRAIHRLSARAQGPFVKINCAALPAHLIESELFGHERGAFTGADARKLGLFEHAHGGTILLDEIGEMDAAAQAKVLRVVELGEVRRTGGTGPVRVDVRVVAATNQDLRGAVKSGRFREDLYFRLAVIPLHCPPLRERAGDLGLLAEAFLAAFCRENGFRNKSIDPGMIAALGRRTFPGNVRELKNLVERAAILAGDVLTADLLPEDPHADPFDDEDEVPPTIRPVRPPPAARDAAETGQRPTLMEYRERMERAYMLEVLESLDWNVSQAARVLGVERTNFSKRIRKYGITRPRRPPLG
jgi:two-component system, NtrC family, nitrogen regulation response regulator NtrX